MFVRPLFALLGSAALSACVAPRDFNQLVPKSPAYEQVAAQLPAEPATDRVRLEQLQNLVRLTLPLEELFPAGGTTLGDAGKTTLARVAPALAQLSGQRVVVKAFTDSVPIADELRVHPNTVELSQARVQVLAAALVAQGVPQAIVTTSGLGLSHPVASNDTAQGRDQNRRVEIDIVEAPK